MKRSEVLLYLATFITNIGNGMFTIVIGKFLYDLTGSPLMFGYVLVFEHFLGVFLQIFAGPLVDKKNPKAICIISDVVRGMSVVFFGVLMFFFHTPIFILLSVLIINIFKPFYRVSIFAMAPLLFQNDNLIKFNSKSSAFMQLGQIIGIGTSGIILFYFSNSFTLIFNGFTYLIAGLLIIFIEKIHVENKIIKKMNYFKNTFYDWKKTLKYLNTDRMLLILIFLCTNDFLAINLINISLVPIVDKFFSGDEYWLSILDGSLAIGALMAGYVALKAIKIIGVKLSFLIGGLSQALVYIILVFVDWNSIIILSMFTFGFFNIVSLTVYVSTIQQNANVDFRGKIGSFRNIVISLVALIFIPIIGNFYEISVEFGLIASSLVCLLFVLSGLFFIKSKYFKNIREER